MREIKELRKLKEKYFENSDGSITAQVYKDNVHYINDGVLRTINNSLIEKDNYYENKYNDFKVKFYKDLTKMVSIIKNENYINFNMENLENFIIEKNEDSVIYKDTLNNVDFIYKVISDKLKEDIIIKSKDLSFTSITFDIETNLALKKENDKIIACDREEVLFTMLPLTVFDKEGNYVTSLNYDLVNNETSYKLNISLANLNDLEESLYPIIIDPTVINGKDINIYDTYISSANTSTNYGSETKLKIGSDSTGNYRTLMKFTLPTIGTGYSIISAKAVIEPFDITREYSTEDKRICVHAITEDWNESNVTWNSINNKIESSVESVFLPNGIGLEYDTTTFDITNLVKSWYSGKPNYGVMLKWAKETYNQNNKVISIVSKEYNVTSSSKMRPYLLITYKNQNGLLSEMTYTTLSHSNGTININNLNGNVVGEFFVNKTLAGKLPVTLVACYNSQDVLIEKNNFAKGFKFNLFEEVEKTTIDDSDWIKYYEQSGALHYFYKKDNQYIDEDNLGLTIKLVNNNYELTDKDGNKRVFSKFNNRYYLTKIIDSENNTIIISYTNNKITKITDANSKEINISYADNLITVTSESETSKIYLSDNKITKIETKEETTVFEYNSYNLISKITDDDNMSKTYEYYSVSPYKLKKVTEYGLNNEVGSSLTYTYSFNSTAITDNKGKKIVYLFNNNGNTTQVNMYTEDNLLSEAYSVDENYIDNSYAGLTHYKNKLMSSSLPKKSVTNLLTNSGFEEDISNCNFTITNGQIQNYLNRTGSYCWTVANAGRLSYQISATDNYTLSFYIWKDMQEAGFLSIRLLKKINDEEIVVDKFEVDGYPYRKDEYVYKKMIFKGYFEEGSTLILDYSAPAVTQSKIDDIQLERGIVANERNLVSNSDFSNGLTSWTVPSNASVVTLPSGEKALKVVSDVDEEVSVCQNLHLKGLIGESYELSFWYKNEGTTTKNDAYENQGAIAIFSMDHTNGEMGDDGCYVFLDSNKDEWQFFRHVFTSTYDYNSASLTILLSHEANNFYITNVMVTQNPRVTGYDYDTNGNLKSINDLNNETTTLKYDSNNQLVSVFNPLGKNFKYEYDNLKHERVRKGISATGISNEFKYDTFGNINRTLITNVNAEVETDKLYYIRCKGTDKYLTNTLKFKEDSCNKLAFKLVKESDYYRIKLGGLLLTYQSNKITLSTNVNDCSLFILNENINGSYAIIPKTDYNKCITISNNAIAVTTKDVEVSENQFYFEDIDTPLYIETKSHYTSDGRFISCVEDALNNKTNYTVDPSSGLITKVIDAKGNITIYTYDDKNRITSILYNDNLITYVYNTNNMLSKIVCDNKEYNFTYDNFLREKTISVNDRQLIENTYEAGTGNLLKKTYGNNSEISYVYDKLERVSKTIKEDNTYDYLYDNSGNISEIIGTNEKYRYSYDLAKRLSEYVYNKLLIEYTYNANNLVSNKAYSYGTGIKEKMAYQYNGDDSLTKVTYATKEFNYIYDYLGRLSESNVNSNLKVNYHYLTNGNKTSIIVDRIKLGEEEYKYKYDSLYNISHIYLNDTLINEYKYDEYNEMILDVDYTQNKMYKYIYDTSGNILSKGEYDLKGNVININHYTYGNSWKDLLTQYNDTSITYDNIGNPLTIGNDTLTWINGRSLSSYTKGNVTTEYKYNIDGIRISKKIGNVEHTYFTEGNNIVFEKIGNSMIYYIRNTDGELLGLKYNNQLYYYKKNYQQDIIGIYNSSYEEIVKYKYDSWGNIISITDNNNQEITDVTNIGLINPFRYRSYYYDTETNLYYLNSRYYNPEWGRFINADSLIGLKRERFAYNLYTYCNNSPSTHIDTKGNVAGAITAVGGVIGGAGGAAAVIGSLALPVGAAILIVAAYAMTMDTTRDTTLEKPKIREKRKKNKKDDTDLYSIYCLTPDISKDTCEYVGRTKSIKQTKIRHQNNPYRANLELKELESNLTYEQARGEEEHYIRKYGTLNRGNFTNNQIHGISYTNPKYDLYMNAACAHLMSKGTTCNYVGGGKWAD